MWAQEPVFTLGKNDKSLALAGIWSPDRPFRSLVAMLVTLYQMRYKRRLSSETDVL